MSEKKPRRYAKLTEQYFYNSAMYYLQRYASTAANLRKVLERKVMRAKMRGDDIPADTDQWIDKAVEKCVQHQFVNDTVYTEQKINSLRRQGRARSFIATTLQQKGVGKEMLQEMLENDPEKEMEAAIRTVKKKRLGQDQTPEGRQKDLGKLCRAGFSFDIAQKALDHLKE
jgi:regulatory protein